MFNVKILLIKNPKKDNCIEIGAETFSKYKSSSEDNLNVIFSINFLKSFNTESCELIFGLFLRSYNFTKYKSKKNNFNIKFINIYNSKNYKLKKISYYSNLLYAINYKRFSI